MNVNFEAIEKAWGKPKKTVLGELEEWLNDEGNPKVYYDWENKCEYVYTDNILDKIQELKKENENG